MIYRQWSGRSEFDAFAGIPFPHCCNTTGDGTERLIGWSKAIGGGYSIPAILPVLPMAPSREPREFTNAQRLAMEGL